jgi:hypothetical protein
MTRMERRTRNEFLGCGVRSAAERDVANWRARARAFSVFFGSVELNWVRPSRNSGESEINSGLLVGL